MPNQSILFSSFKKGNITMQHKTTPAKRQYKPRLGYLTREAQTHKS